MSWENELRPEIKFVSPSTLKSGGSPGLLDSALQAYGITAQSGTFTAKWISGERTKEKKLGQFDPPKFDGTLVQDMGVKSVLYPLTIYFDGLNHQRDAENFFNELSEPGAWKVVHPTKGPMLLQLVSVKEMTSPVDHGSYTAFDMQWIAPANETYVMSFDELAAALLSSIINGVLDAFTILEQLRADLYSAIQSAINTFNKIVGIMDVIIKEIAATQALAQDAYDTARAAYTNALAQFNIDDPDTSDISAQMANMALAPTDANSDFTTRYSQYNEMLTDVGELVPAMNTVEDYNKVVSIEYGVSLSLLAIAQIVATSEFSSRADVISAMENIVTSFNSAVAAIEAAQDNFIGLDIDFQYFSQTKNYTSLINTYTLALQYLTSQFYNLHAEKRFTVKNPASPLALTVQEYGSLGENDENYDLFIASNQLSGNEIELLPAGKEVVVYVG